MSIFLPTNPQVWANMRARAYNEEVNRLYKLTVCKLCSKSRLVERSSGVCTVCSHRAIRRLVGFLTGHNVPRDWMNNFLWNKKWEIAHNNFLYRKIEDVVQSAEVENSDA